MRESLGRAGSEQHDFRLVIEQSREIAFDERVEACRRPAFDDGVGKRHDVLAIFVHADANPADAEARDDVRRRGLKMKFHCCRIRPPRLRPQWPMRPLRCPRGGVIRALGRPGGAHRTDEIAATWPIG